MDSLWNSVIGSTTDLRKLLLETHHWGQPVTNISSSRMFHIGGVLPNQKSAQYFQNEINKLNFDGNSVSDRTTLYHVTMVSSGSPIRDARLVCTELIAKGVFAIVLGGQNISSAASAAVSYTAGFYHIPVLGTSSRESAFSDKNIHISFLRTVPPYSHQADVWIELLKIFRFTQVVFIHCSDSDGRALLGRLQTHLDSLQDDRGIKLSMVVEFDPGESRHIVADKLKKVFESPVRVILLFASQRDADTILVEARRLGMTGEGTVWILTEETLFSYYAPLGSIGLRLKYSRNQVAHLADSLRLIALGLKELQTNQSIDIIDPPSTCEVEEPWNITGNELFKTLENLVLVDGKTGKVAFDQKGDRLYAEYDVINVQNDSNPEAYMHKSSEIYVPVGKYFYDKEKESMQLSLKSSKMIWGGGTRVKPSGIAVARHMKVLTVLEVPFVYAETLEKDDTCSDDGTLCFMKNLTTQETDNKCCTGYCVELLASLAEVNNFTYDLHVVPGGNYGSLNYSNGQRAWTGMIGELVNKTHGADMIVAPLTINPERAQVMDFSKPFKYQGIKILIKKDPHTTSFVSILQPFQLNLWLMLLGTVHGIALLIWLLDRLSPMFKRKGSETDSIRMSDSFWFSWGVILNSGLGEGTPRCLSARVMSMIWAGFAMILVASYTANLAAFLVLEDRKTSIAGINDAKLRNPVEDFLFATVKGSAVDMFFRRKTEWSNMYRVMETNNFDDVDSAIEAVRNGSLQAFIWDSTRLEYEATQDCNLITVGDMFGRSGYGIGLRKDSLWSEKISLSVLEFHESGYMAELDDRWIWDHGPECPPEKIDAPERLGLANLEGIFMMVVFGVVIGIFLIIFELLYNRSFGRRSILRVISTKIEKKKEPPIPLTDVNSTESPHTCMQCSKQNHNTRLMQRIYNTEASMQCDINLRDLTPEDWIKYYIQQGGYVDSSHNVVSIESLEDLLEFVQENHIQEFSCPHCGFSETDSENSDSPLSSPDPSPIHMYRNYE